MYHPSNVLFSASFPSATSFLKESGFSCLRGYDVCSGYNSVWMTNRATLFACSLQFSSSIFMVMISSSKLSIDASVAVISNARGSAFVR